MSVAIRLVQAPSGDRRDRNGRDEASDCALCWQELVHLAVGGAFPGGQWLEHVLDRIERRP